jgi:hypothetical protein
MKLFGLDEKIELAKGTGFTTIREQHQKGKIRPGKDTIGYFAEVDRDSQGYASFRVSEVDFKALGGT